MSHVFNSFPENWFGRWMKIGHDYGTSCWSDLLCCSSCKYECGRSPVRLYSVRGLHITNPIFTWSLNSCSNVSGGCWGPESRFWQVSTGYTGNEFVFKTFLGSTTSNSLSFMDELRVRMDQGSGYSRLLYTCIGIGRQCKQFLPLINSSSGSPYCMVLVKIRSGESPPANRTILEKLEYVYPNHIMMKMFQDERNKKRSFNDKVTESELENSWNEIG